MKLPRHFPALSCRNYRLFWSGQCISLTGTWMQSVAQGWLVYSLTKSPLLLGLVAAALSGPVLFLSLFGGVVADLADKRRLLLATQSMLMIPALMLAYLSSSGQITVPWIVCLSIIQGVLNSLELPARQSYWSELLPRRYRDGGNSLNAVSFNGTRILGPLLAGSIIASSGLPLCFLLNAASFMAGITTLLLIRPRRKLNRKVPSGSITVIADLREGLRYAAEQRDIALVLLLVAVISLFGIPFIPLLPVFADSILNVGPQGLGYLASACGVGSLLTAVMLAYRGNVGRKGRIIAAAGMLFAVCLFLFAHSEVFKASLLALISVGAGMVAFLACASCFLQHSCPDQLRGRVMGMYTFALIGMAPFGHAAMGLLASRIGVVDALSCSSAVCGTAILLSFKMLNRIA
jgi:MFS family permease